MRNDVDCASFAHRSSAYAIAIALTLALALTGCALDPGGRPASVPETATYVGVFTGEYVDGKPLYRFPPIHVLGSRSRDDGS